MYDQLNHTAEQSKNNNSDRLFMLIASMAISKYF